MQLQSDRKGVTALEYGLIAAIMGAAVITAFAFLDTGLTTIFTNISGRLSATLP